MQKKSQVPRRKNIRFRWLFPWNLGLEIWGLGLLSCTLSSPAFSQVDKYSRAKIFCDETGFLKLSRLGIAVDHGEIKKGTYFISDFSAAELKKISEAGFNLDILIDDVTLYYQKQNSGEKTPDKFNGGEKKSTPNPEKAKQGGCFANPATYTVPSNFSLGTMGGFPTYNEMLAQLDSMAAKFPLLITSRQPVDTLTSIEGRPIYWLKISDNPDSNESEPEVLYTALTHAREPAGLSQMLFFMWYLLENYGTDAEVTYLVDNVELYFIPCVNPDGYLYNQTTNPSGGGQWRKNRRNNGDGTFGVDVNRNFGYLWGYDNYGSSPITVDNTYRGTAPFSEPETQAVKLFCEAHQFRIALNYHTFGNFLIYPWGYASTYTPDSALYVNYAQLLTSENSYTYGTGYQTVGYNTNGDSDDWMYGEQSSKPKIMSMTPESGSGTFGFWPPSGNIIGICQENMLQNLLLAQVAGNYAIASDQTPAILSQDTGYIFFSLERLGLDSIAAFSVSVISIDSGFTILGSPKQYSNLPLLVSLTDSFEYTLDTSIVSAGQEVHYLLAVNNGFYSQADTISKIYGQPISLLADNGNNFSNWTTTSWGLSGTVYHSADSSITDSPPGNYSNNTSKAITLTNPVDLTGALYAGLNFWAKWEIEGGYDYVQVLASDDGGTTWIPLCGKFTKEGSNNQDPGEPLYDGFQNGWVYEEISLNPFSGKTIQIRFRLISDGGVTYDGFYFDDLTINTISSTMTSATVGNSSPVFNVIPNPFSGRTLIRTEGMTGKIGTVQVRITDPLGREVHPVLEYASDGIFIHAGKLNPGIYFFEIYDRDHLKTGSGKLIAVPEF